MRISGSPDEVYKDTEIPSRSQRVDLLLGLTHQGGAMDERQNAKVRERAYQLFLSRGNAPGNATEDWLRAEEQVREEESHHRGPARIADARHHGRLTDAHGCDIENPT